jgi:hypothetical protein
MRALRAERLCYDSGEWAEKKNYFIKLELGEEIVVILCESLLYCILHIILHDGFTYIISCIYTRRRDNII